MYSVGHIYSTQAQQYDHWQVKNTDYLVITVPET